MLGEAVAPSYQSAQADNTKGVSTCYPSHRMEKNHAALSSYHFVRTKPDGLVKILNENSYVMAEYNQHTGIVQWQRIVLATHREIIEKSVRERFPVHAAAWASTASTRSGMHSHRRRASQQPPHPTGRRSNRSN